MALSTTLIPNSEQSERQAWWVGFLWVLLFLLFWVNLGSSYLPTPWGVLSALPSLWSEGGLGVALYTSFILNLEALSIMFVVTYALAIASVMPLFRPLSTLLSSGRFNGFVGMPLVFMAFFHDTHEVKIALLVYGSGVFTLMSLVQMIQSIPRDSLDHSRTLRMGEWRVVWEVVVLGQFHAVLDIIAVNAAMLYMMLPMVEGLFRFEGGVGALMQNEAKHFGYDAVFCTLLLVLAVGLLQDLAIRMLRKIICPYASD